MLDLDQVLRDLASRGVVQVLVEGGARVHASFLRRGFVDEIAVFTGPRLLGGTALPWLPHDVEVAHTITRAPAFVLRDVVAFRDSGASSSSNGGGGGGGGNNGGNNDVLCIYEPAP